MVCVLVSRKDRLVCLLICVLSVLPPGVSPLFENSRPRVAQARDAFISMMKDKGITVSAVHQRNDVHSCVQE